MSSSPRPEPTDPPLMPAYAVGRLGRLVRKELSEILRDRRTVITLVLMPLLLYPLLSIAFRQFLLASRLSAEDPSPYLLCFARQEEFALFLHEIQVGREVLRRDRSEEAASDLSLAEPLIQAAVEQAVLGSVADLGVRVPDADAVERVPGRDMPLACKLIHRRDSSRGREALSYVERLLAAAQRYYLETRAPRPGASRGVIVLRPVSVVLEDPEHRDLVSLAPLIPLVLILMTITGAVYPAIDLTAGERERGTLEILVAAPVPRLGLLFAKYVSVLTVAVLTALVNLVTMFTTVSLSGLGSYLFPAGGPSLLLMVELFGLLLLFASFFSAVLLTLTSFARSFKEAQAYLVPLMLASLGPGLVGLVPRLQLSGLLTVVPLVNIVLLARDLLDGRAALPMAGLVVASTLLYALAAIAAAARVFGSEGVLYNEQSTWSDLWRRPARPQPAPTVAGALFCLALLFPTQFMLQGILARVLGPMPTVDHLVALVLVSALLFGVFPVTAALWRRVRIGSGLRLRPAPWPAAAAAFLLGLSLWPLVLTIPPLLQRLGLTTMDLANLRRVADQLRGLRVTAPILLPVALALLGILEELFFRGYLFSALRASSGPGPAVVISALLFGLFHLVTDGFALDRLLPSTLLGLVLAWVGLRSGSVLPPMLLHGLHNAILATLPRYHEALGLADGDLREALLPVPWLLGSAAGVGIGLALLAWVRPPADAADDPLT